MKLRRWLAWCIAAQFIVLLFAPLLITTARANELPACCRRAGMHHCAMDIDLHGEGFRAQPCAQFPTSAHALLTHAANTTPAALSVHELLRAFATKSAVAVRAHSGALSTADSRGPPSPDFA